MHKKYNYIANQRGSILPITMVTMLIISIMATTAMYMSFSDFKLTAREAHKAQARSLSEAAITEAMAKIREDVSNGNYSTNASSGTQTLSTGEYQYSIASASNGLTTKYTITSMGESKNGMSINNEVALELIRQDSLRQYTIFSNQRLKFSNNGSSSGTMLRYGAYFANSGITFTDGTKLKIKQDVSLVTPDSITIGTGVNMSGSHTPSTNEDASSLELPTIDPEEFINRLQAAGMTVEYYEDNLTLDDNSSAWQRRSGYQVRAGDGTLVAEIIVIVVKGDIEIENSADIGSNNKPVMLFALDGGKITIGAKSHVYGFIYAEGDLDVAGDEANNTKIEGILMSGGDVNINGPVKIWDNDQNNKNTAYFDQLYNSLPAVFDFNITSWEEQ